jgi:thioredoxin 1
VAQIVTADNFKQEVLESNVPVLVDFYADWCGPCRAVATVLSEMSAEADGKYKIVKVNADHDGELCVQWSVNVLPTLIVFKDGQPRQRLLGAQNKNKLIEALEL